MVTTSMPDTTQKLKIIYIAGAGHSGSTLLDCILSTAPAIFSVGELKYLQSFLYQETLHNGKKLIDDDAGYRPNTSPIWRDIATSPERYIPPVQQRKRLNFRDRLSLLLWGKSRTIPYSYRYQELYEATANNAAQVLQKDISCIIDSSKTLTQLIEITNRTDYEVYVIHLVRDARGVASSYKYAKQPVWRSAYVWWLTNRAIGKYCSKNISPNRYMQIRYEDLILNTERTLTTLSSFTGLAIESSNLINKIHQTPSYRFSGNIIRRSGVDKLQLDEKWKTRLRWWEKALIAPINNLRWW